MGQTEFTDETILSDTALLLAYSIEQVIFLHSRDQTGRLCSCTGIYMPQLLESDNLVKYSRAYPVSVSTWAYFQALYRRRRSNPYQCELKSLYLLANTGDSIESIAYASY